MDKPDSTLQALCARYQAVILHHDATHLRVAVADAPDPLLLEALQFASQCAVEVECWPHGWSSCCTSQQCGTARTGQRRVRHSRGGSDSAPGHTATRLRCAL